MAHSIFVDIIERRIPADIVAENDHLIVIKDINPQTPIHFLIISKDFFVNIPSSQPTDDIFGMHVMAMARYLSKNIQGAEEFKLIMNNGKKAGQCVFHAHVHFLAGY